MPAVPNPLGLMDLPPTRAATEEVFVWLRDLGSARDHVGVDFNRLADWVNTLDGYNTPREVFYPTDYRTFYDWFLRRISPTYMAEVRHMAGFAKVVSPVQARVTQTGRLGDGHIPLKQGRADVAAALQPYASEVESYSFVKFSLLKCHYHHVHAPITGKVVAVLQFDSQIDPFGHDAATVVILESELGRVFVCAVGERTVQNFHLSVGVGQSVQATEELGWFWWGSMVLVAFPPGLSTLVGERNPVMVGSPIANPTLDSNHAKSMSQRVARRWLRGGRA